MSNIKCPICKVVSKKTFNPTLVNGYKRVVYNCGTVIDYFGLNHTFVVKCEKKDPLDG